MAKEYLPEWATVQEAADWLQAATGESWPLPRLLEANLLPHVWLAPNRLSASVLSVVFDGRQEGFLAPLVFAGDLHRLSVERTGAMSMTRNPAGELLQFTPPIPFTTDELRFAAPEVRNTATLLGDATRATKGVRQGEKHESESPPDWSHWRQLAEVRLFEAVYLMLDVEPPSVPPDEDEQPDGYTKTLRLLSQAMRDRSQFSPCSLNVNGPALCSVRLSEVGAWASRIGRGIPREFPKASPSSLSGIVWPLWLALPSVELWQGVALVLGINPERLKRSPGAWMAGAGGGPIFLAESFPNPHREAEFERAMGFAVQATNHAGPIHITGSLAIGMNKRTAQVALADVVAFFKSCEWPDIPHELSTPATRAAAAPQVRQSETVTADVPADDGAAKGQWKMKIQQEAARQWKALEAQGCSPTVKSIVDPVARWCRENGVRTDSGIFPTGNYLRTHVLGGSHWRPPR